MGVSDPPGEEEICGSNPQPKHAIANCSQTVSHKLPPGEYKRLERFRQIIYLFSKLLSSLLLYRTTTTTTTLLLLLLQIKLLLL